MSEILSFCFTFLESSSSGFCLFTLSSQWLLDSEVTMVNHLTNTLNPIGSWVVVFYKVTLLFKS